MNIATPSDITVDRTQKTMRITWGDDSESRIPFGLLRAACPCAECRGGHENMRSTPDPEVFQISLHDSREQEIADVQAVGNYGLTIAWGDGHKFGIYTWAYLRALGEGADAGQLVDTPPPESRL